MQTNEEPFIWQLLGSTVRGASHIRSGLVNQDSIKWIPQGSSGYPTVMAVADGHGSAKCFRSDQGSKLAVATAVEVLSKFGESCGEYQPSQVKRLAEEQLPETLVKCWLKLVETDFRDKPFTADELAILESKEGLKTVEAVTTNPPVAYGATVLVVYADRNYILYVQLGDGDIVAVSTAGVATRPMPEDDRLMANETTSLCGPKAWRDVRVAFQPVSEASPTLILVSTDGYANSFRSENDFLKVGSDVLTLLTDNGPEYVQSNMESWLTTASESGSGDDVTLGLLYRAGSVANNSTSEKTADQFPLGEGG